MRDPPGGIGGSGVRNLRNLTRHSLGTHTRQRRGRPIWLREVPRTASHCSHDLSPLTADEIARCKGQSFKLALS